jgi:phospholipid/cholesterol/gamma-HCH transport system substrate-binding protein
MGRSIFETVLGAVVLGVAALFLSFAYSSSNVHKVQGYTLSANFPMVDGVKDGTDVEINGVKVGSITGLHLITDPGPNEYLVNVKMSIRPDIQLPTDTIAMIASESLLGGKYMSLEPGIEEDMIKTDGTGRITRTQAPMRLDDLIGQLIYGSKRGDDSSSGAGNAPAGGAAPANKSAPAHP